MSNGAKFHSFPSINRFYYLVLTSGIVFLFCVLVSLNNRAYGQSQEPVRPTGHEKHKISLKDAAALTRNYRKSHEDNAVTGEFFGKDALMAALNQDGCIGLRIYYGNRTDGTPVMVFVGVDKSGNDLADGVLGEEGLLCPPVCGEDNPLTHDEVTISELLQTQAQVSPK